VSTFLQEVRSLRDTPTIHRVKREIVEAATEGRSGCAVGFTRQDIAKEVRDQLLNEGFECTTVKSYDLREGTEYRFTVEW